MKRFLQLSLIIPLFLFAQQKNVAVLQFDADNVSDSEARILTNRLNTELFNTGKYVVIERSQMEEVMKEQGLQQSACVSSECAVEVGKLLGVDAMITGSIGRIGSFYTISARMVDVESGKIINTISKDVSGSIDIVLTKTMAEIAYQLSNGSVQIPKIIPKPEEVVTTEKEYYDDGQLKKESKFKYDGPYGEWYSWHPNGQMKEKGHWRNAEYYLIDRWSSSGKFLVQNGDGGWIIKNEDGSKKLKKLYKRGEITGEWTYKYTKYESGQIKSEVSYKNGKRDGISIVWHENGQKNSEVSYRNGKRDGILIVWHENGQKNSEVSYKYGIRNGILIVWHENGQKKEEGLFRNDVKVGEWTSWDEYGNIIRTTKDIALFQMGIEDVKRKARNDAESDFFSIARNSKYIQYSVLSSVIGFYGYFEIVPYSKQGFLGAIGSLAAPPFILAQSWPVNLPKYRQEELLSINEKYKTTYLSEYKKTVKYDYTWMATFSSMMSCIFVLSIGIAVG